MISAHTNMATGATGPERVTAVDEKASTAGSDVLELVARCQSGCRQSFDELVACYAPRLFNFIFQLVRNREDAEDLTQETFLKAYQGIHRYRSSYSFTTWLFTIAKRSAIDHFRAHNQHEPLADYDEVDAQDPSVLTEQQDERTAIWNLVRQLPPKQFEVLWLRYAEGFSIAETARIMNATQIYVKVLLHRARKQLALRLTPN